MSKYFFEALRGGHPSLSEFSYEADKVIDEALRDDKQDLRKWAWEHALFPPGLPVTARETQTLRLMRFIETGSFDETQA